MNTIRKIGAIWLSSLLVVCAANDLVKVPEAEALIADKVQLLDVRTEQEWKEGHLANAVRVDYLEKGFSEKVAKVIDPKKPVLVYCRKGSRSEGAVKIMKELGYTQIHELDGGFVAWQRAGKKVVK